MTRLLLLFFTVAILAYSTNAWVQPFMSLIYRSTAPSRTYRHQNVAKNEAQGYIDEIYNVEMTMGSSRELNLWVGFFTVKFP
jgi:hypothetical protein